jgi:hypothetical protein
VPDESQPNLRSHGRPRLAATPSPLWSALLAPFSPAVVGLAAEAEVRGAKRPFVGLGAGSADSRTVDRQRQPRSDSPVVAAVLLQKLMHASPQQRKNPARRGDQRSHQALISGHRRAPQDIQRPSMRLTKRAGERAALGPRPHDRQEHQLEWLPTGIAMKLPLVENPGVNNPSYRRQQGLSVQRPRPARRGRIRSLSHLSQTPFNLRCSQSWWGESGFFRIPEFL